MLWWVPYAWECSSGRPVELADRLTRARASQPEIDTRTHARTHARIVDTRAEIFSFFFCLRFFEIEGCHHVALAERSSNLPSNFKMINHRPGNFIFRAGVRTPEERRVRRDPPVEGPSPHVHVRTCSKIHEC